MKSNRIFKVCSTIYMLLISFSYAQNSPDYVVLNSCDPTDEQYQDFEQLEPYFKNVKLLGLGEATHGTSEFTTMRHRLFRYLATKHQFNTLFMEEDFGACLQVDAYVHGADIPLKEAMSDFPYWAWQTTEMMEFFKWIREYNSTHPNNQISIVGANMQAAPSNLQQLVKRLPKGTSKETLAPFTKGMFLEEEAASIVNPEVKKLMSDYSNDYIMYQLCNVILENTENNFKENAEVRDVFMAQNILQYLERFPDAKGMFIPHNGHMNMRAPNRKKNGAAGYYLKETLQDKYLCVGTEFYVGTYNAFKRNKAENKLVFGAYEMKADKLNYLGKYMANYAPITFITRSEIPKKVKWAHTCGTVYSEDRNGLYQTLDLYDAFIVFENMHETDAYKQS